MKMLLLQDVTIMQVGTKFIFGQDYRSLNFGDAHPITEGPSEQRKLEAPHADNYSTPITIFLLFFMEVIWLLVAD
jgi:hypothetical protein